MSKANIPNNSPQQGSDDNLSDYEFTDEEIKILDERRQNRLTGKSKTYSWEEAKKIITGNKQSAKST